MDNHKLINTHIKIYARFEVLLNNLRRVSLQIVLTEILK